jgi:hypothetical protein
MGYHFYNFVQDATSDIIRNIVNSFSIIGFKLQI